MMKNLNPTRYLFLLLSVTLAHFTYAQVSYPDKKLPADIPLLFGKDILSDGLNNRDFTMSPTGDELFFTLQQPGFLSSTILRIQKSKGKWGKPQVAPFSGKYRDLEASFSPDGKYVYFVSDRPVKGSTPKTDFDIWKIKKTVNGWGVAEHLDTVINTSKDEYYPSVAKNGNLYFTANLKNGKGKDDIVISKFIDNKYTKPVSLSENINSPEYEFNAYIDPDEQFILFTSFGRKDDIGGGDLYISHRDKDGNWLPSKHLPAPFNSTGIDYCPFVTRDRKYLIFTSSRAAPSFTDHKFKTYQEWKELLSKTRNGSDDLYWVRFDANW